MKIYEKRWSQMVHGELEEVWKFFSRPENLEKITPDDMKFEIVTNVREIEMYPGILIRYKVSPFPRFKIEWTTEITAVKDCTYFIDEQRFGPFKLWHHQHHFESVEGGVLMQDILHYAIPFGILGRLMNKWSISRRIERIFEYRKSVIADFFPDRRKS